MAKCKLCPRKRVCRDECYGDNPCDFALAFDKLGKKIDLKTVCVESLKTENAQLRKEKDAAGADFKELAKTLIYEASSFGACHYCAKNATCQDDCDFEWRGIQEG